MWLLVTVSQKQGSQNWDVEWLRMDQDSNLEELYDDLRFLQGSNKFPKILRRTNEHSDIVVIFMTEAETGATWICLRVSLRLAWIILNWFLLLTGVRDLRKRHFSVIKLSQSLSEKISMWLEAAKSGHEMSEWSQIQCFLLKGCDIFILPQTLTPTLTQSCTKANNPQPTKGGRAINSGQQT